MPQLIPAGLLVTVPLADPAMVVCKVNVSLLALKVAVTDVLAFMVTVQLPVPLQPPPLQPAKTDPLDGVVVRVTEVPLLNDAEQVLPQMIPSGVLVTVPLPVPALVTVRVPVILKVCALEVPPPGEGLKTVTCAVPGVAISLEGMDALSCVLLTKVVVRPDPFHRTTEDSRKLLPLTVRVKPAPPAVALLGESEVRVATGLLKEKLPTQVPHWLEVVAYSPKIQKLPSLGSSPTPE